MSDSEERELTADERLLARGSDEEKRLLSSRELDRPRPGARERALELALREQRAARGSQSGQPFKHVLPGLAALSLAAGVTFWVWQRPASEHARLAAVSAEPAAQVSAPATAPAQQLPDVCVTPVVASGSSPLIDDLEDRDARVLPFEGRIGIWGSSNDGTGKQVPAMGKVFHPSLIPGGRGHSRYALHSSGGVFKDWGALISVELAGKACYDAAIYAGISFWAKGPGRVSVAARTVDVIPESDGGTCKVKCYDSHASEVVLSSGWREYSLTWRDLRQAGFGTPTAFDAHRMWSLDIGVNAADTPFDIWIDDLSFVSP